MFGLNFARFTLFLPFLWSLLHVSALPFDELTAILPRAVTHIALDEETNEFVAFERDGTLHGRYLAHMEDLYQRRDDTASTCTNLTVDEAKTLSGWDAIVQYADDNWGTGSRSIVTNPSQYPGSPAEVCITNQAIEATLDGDPTCETNNVTTSGQLVGTNGTVAIAVAQGYTATAQFTVSTAATIGLSDTMSVSIKIPEVTDVSESITVSTSVTDTQTSSFSAAYSELTTVTVTMTAPAGKTCDAISSVTSCTLQATGEIQYIASGWIWFNYDDKTHGHYKWAASLEAILDETDRSSYATFRGSVVADTHASYQGTCS
ncbi:hypothetical protein GYMLUDRAFT_242415 [Collybiopsis luxurians FD-317 M1]|uniref:Uncharacterized protein n=1 Tax=Collybiopsis luxurians FD-317 M1 TaxID=944289 RepID=A0A0D0BFS7_9AGAR|nr:hypothetical protein GYMLUDRAFT_242415 [Collybiopsis luxurians FD-317 M1]